MFDKDNKFGFINNNESNNIKNADLPYVKSEIALFEITIDQLNKAWAETQTSDDTSIYIIVPTFDIDDSNMFFIEYNGKRHRVDSISKDATFPARWDIEFYNAEDKDNNIMGGYVGTHYDKDWNDSNTTALVKIDRLDDAQPPVFTDAMRLIEVRVHQLDSLLLGKDVDIYNSISIRRNPNTAIGDNSIAIGLFTEASSMGTSATGFSTKASGDCAHAEGSRTTASGSSSHAEGMRTTASGNYSHAEGYITIASGNNQHVQGKYNIEDKANKYAHIVGNGKDGSNRSNAHTLDWKGNGWYSGQVEGTNLPYTISSKVLATVPASNIKLDNPITISNVSINKDRRYYIEFLGSKKLCNLSVDEELGNAITCSIGNYAIQSYNNSTNISLSIIKLNEDTTTDTFTDLVIYEEEVKYLDNKYLETDLTLQNSISLGRIGDIGTGSSAIGMGVTSSGDYSHAEGSGTKASEYCSHAEGNNTTASGECSHAEGEATKSIGICSHSEGGMTTASGECSHAEGMCTIASSNYQHVQGKYNIEDKANKYAHIVGNGTSDTNRANAHTLDWEGNAWYSGKLSQEGTPTEDKDLVTKKYVDDKVSGSSQLSFNETGELVVTINGVSKIFVPKE